MKKIFNVLIVVLILSTIPFTNIYATSLQANQDVDGIMSNPDGYESDVLTRGSGLDLTWTYINNEKVMLDYYGNRVGTGPCEKVIDVSQYNGLINWNLVKNDGVDGAIMRISSYAGGLHEDEQFSNNLQGCRNVNMPFGVYLYSYATNTNDALKEANFVINTLKKYNVSKNELYYPVYYDLEGNSTTENLTVNEYETIIKTFMDRLSQEGYKVNIYSYKSYLETNLNSQYIHENVSWVAQYGRQLTFENNYYDGKTGWQYRSNGTVAGINSEVDISCFYGESAKLTGMLTIDRGYGIDVGTGYVSNTYNISFKWQAYNLDTQEWTTIADWNGGNWATWVPNTGNYWLYVELKLGDEIIDSDIMCYSVGHNYQWYSNFDLQGLTWNLTKNGIDEGVSYKTNQTNPLFKWQAYNIDTQEWTTIADWNKSNWATWKPKIGNYWLYVEGKAPSGQVKSLITCFRVDNDYQKTYIDINGLCWIVRDTGIDVGVAYESNNNMLNFKWQAYNLDTQKWTTIADWNGGNWATWKPKTGNYWLHLEIKSNDGVSTQETICFRVDGNYN